MRYDLVFCVTVFGLVCATGLGQRSGTEGSGPMVLVSSGRARAAIVVGEEASAQAREAATELQTYVRRMTGAELAIGDREPSGPEARVLVGQAAARDWASRAGVELPSGLSDEFDDEGYVVAAGGKALVLAGNETDPYQGTLYAVYDFLESLGCRWYFPGESGEVIPRHEAIVCRPMRKTVRPEFRVRDTWYSGHLAVTPQQAEEYRLWRQRNRMSQSRLWGHCLSDDARFLQNPVDDSTFRLLPKERYWEAHPDFYALMPGGARNERFVCMSNPGAFQAAVDTIAEFFEQHPDFHTFAFSPPDEPVLCHCPDCTAAMHGGYDGEGNGAVSDAYFRFVFRLADEIATRCPGRWITTMAYYNRCRPPEGIEGKRPNLLIQLASIQQCTVHSYADPTCPSRQDYAAMLRRWSALTAGQVFYEYDPHDWSHSQRPGWRAQGIADDLRLLKQLGGWGYSNEGQMAWLGTGLNYYLRAHLAWDLNQDPAALERGSFQGFFGPAAEPMGQYYLALEDAIRRSKVHVFAGWDPPAQIEAVPLLFPRALLDRCATLLDAAAEAAVEEPFRTRVAAFRGQFDRIDASVRAREAMARGDYTDAVRQGKAMAEAVARVGDTMLLQDAGPWGGSASGPGVAAFAERIAPWTGGAKGRLLLALPEAASFCTDPAPQGVVHRWYLPGAGRGWRAVRLTSAWHNQGVVTAEGRPYRGVGWYRVDLDLPQVPEGPVRLYLPDLRGSAAWVWCNGQFAGHVTQSAGADLIVALDGLLRPGPNLLVFRVEGAGGLTLPPFLFVPSAELQAREKRVEISALPSEWLFRTDPEDRGQAQGWQAEDADTSGWRAIPVPACWENTWLGPYDGVAWYRARFRLPAEAEGKRLELHFGAVDEEAWVYLNGELIGEHTAVSTGQTVHQIWDKPFDIPVPKVRFGEENALVVRVRDSQLMGGIFEPVKLYALPE